MSESTPPPSRGVGGPVERHHASDQVFRELASAILRRELEAGAPLPPERELSERFGVSRIVVREAIHRLKEYELVRVRQGSPTLVLNPDDATDMRLLGLEIELMPPTSPDGPLGAFAERQLYSGAALLDLAEQRMTVLEIDALEKLVDEFIESETLQQDWLAFERTYWLAIARGTRNPLFVRETLWYFNLLARDARFHQVFRGPALMRAHNYKSFIAAQRNRSGSAGMYLEAVRIARAMADAERSGANAE